MDVNIYAYIYIETQQGRIFCSEWIWLHYNGDITILPRNCCIGDYFSPVFLPSNYYHSNHMYKIKNCFNVQKAYFSFFIILFSNSYKKVKCEIDYSFMLLKKSAWDFFLKKFTNYLKKLTNTQEIYFYLIIF